MYIARLTYKVNEEVKTLTFNVRECYSHINAHGSNCHMALPHAADVKLESFAAEHVELQLVELMDENEQVIYNSVHWNRIDGVNSQYPAEGEPHCEVYFAHTEPEVETEEPVE